MSLQDFSQFDLDSRIIKSINQKLQFSKPTLIQETLIPFALKGQNILGKSKTGSGKTAAYCIPLVQKILSKGEKSIQGLILVPTRELALQVTKVLKDLCIFCSKYVEIVNIAMGDVSIKDQIPVLEEQPHIIVSTPARIAQHLQAGNVILVNSLETLIIDEADLILSYGYDEDMNTILKYMPQVYQSYLMSATLTPDVDKLKKLILHKPVILQLEEHMEDDLLTQYYIRCPEDEKYLLTLFMLKLKVHPFGSSKSLIFVNSIEKCYKVKLFLEQFGIKSCTLSSELPVKSRYHIVQEFNRGVYDFLIATDEAADEEALLAEQAEEEAAGLNDEIAIENQDNEKGSIETEIKKDSDAMKVDKEDQENISEKPKKEKKQGKKKFRSDEEYGVSRGIDFKNVSAVINFDMPRSSRSYQHRVGRTARGVGNKGYALTFVCPSISDKPIYQQKWTKDGTYVKVQVFPDEKILKRIEKRQEAMGRTLLLFKFDMTPVERFRYRCADALRAVTDAAVREARAKELKMEILNSEKLKTHFEDNPVDLAALRHDRAIHPAKIQPHMRHIPSYLLPKGKLAITTGESTVGYVPFKIEKRRKGGWKAKMKAKSTKVSKRKSDPLKSFKSTSG